MSKIIRTERRQLKATELERQQLRATVAVFRAYCQALSGIVLVHWPDIAAADGDARQGVVERLMHRTRKNPAPVYDYLDRKFSKFPSYLRRAAINLVIGQVSSYITRYDRWVGGQRRRRTERPPVFNPASQLNPTLFRGQLIKFNAALTAASFKVWTGSDWVWTRDIPLSGGRKHRSDAALLSPTLLAHGKDAAIGCPRERSVIKYPRSAKVAAFDLGINSIAAGAVVFDDGTVEARRFFAAARDIDRRDKALATISQAASKTMGRTGKLGKGFCSRRYAKGRNRNRQIAAVIARAMLAFATAYGCTVLVFEHLKHFRPKARGRLKQRFHGWLHRALVQRVASLAEEQGLRVAFVNPAGTSKYAYDGSGEVKRDARNKALATFSNGKQYNADLNACYNIGARWHAKVLGLNARNGKACAGGKSSSPQPRTPVTLSSLWLHALSGCDAEQETATSVV